MSPIAKKAWTVLGLSILALVLVVVGQNMKTPHVAIVAPEQIPEGETLETASPDVPPSAPSPAKAKAPQTKPISSPAPKEIILDLSSEFTRTYQHELAPFLMQPADFNDHYVVARWRCGSQCTMTGVIDKQTGRAYLAPSDIYGSKTPGPFVPYTLGSNLFRVINEDVIDVYSFDGTRFTLVSIEPL